MYSVTECDGVSLTSQAHREVSCSSIQQNTYIEYFPQTLLLHGNCHLFSSSFNVQVNVHCLRANSFGIFHVTGRVSGGFHHQVRCQKGRQYTANDCTSEQRSCTCWETGEQRIQGYGDCGKGLDYTRRIGLYIRWKGAFNTAIY